MNNQKELYYKLKEQYELSILDLTVEITMLDQAIITMIRPDQEEQRQRFIMQQRKFKTMIVAYEKKLEIVNQTITNLQTK